MKRLICCLDGTWNNDEAKSVLTNVAKLQRHILPVDANGINQLSHYVAGIDSAKDTRAQFIKGAIGIQLEDRIKEGYAFLVENYLPGDAIFLFGLSRGAFEARSLAAFIGLVGIGRKGPAFSIEQAWDYYRQPEANRSATDLEKLRATAHFPAKIKCIGVWDTVGNIGIPLLSAHAIGPQGQFHDMRLAPDVDVALHALSIDEARGPFRPTLWTKPRNSPPQSGQHIEQVWFAGAHADVGGGYDESELSDLSLLWMVGQVEAKAGLAFDREKLSRSTRPNAFGVQHASDTGALFKWSGYLPFVRLINQNDGAIPRLRRLIVGAWRTGKLGRNAITVNETVHDSAFARFGQTVREVRNGELREFSYQPRNLELFVEAYRKSHPEVDATAAVVPAAGDASRTTVKLVTVHGTGAGEFKNTGDRWWQLTSPFLKELSKRLDIDPARVEIVPFQWGPGPNSEIERRKAAARLYEKLRGYDKSGVDYYLIGHSHGGSVIYDTLLRSVVVNAPLERLKSWCTVGTPFLDYQPNRYLHSRLEGSGLTLYATALGALAFTLALIYKLVSDSVGKPAGEAWHKFTDQFLVNTAVPVTYGIVCLALLYVLDKKRGGWHTPDAKKKVASLYADRWLGLFHRDDEAISALSNVKLVSGPIVPANFLVPMVSIVPVLLTIIASVAAPFYLLDTMWKLAGDSSAKMASSAQAATATKAASHGTPLTAILIPIAIIILVPILYIALTSGIVALLKIIAHGIGWPLSKMIDGLVWSSVRQQAWGDDRGNESVAEISAHPPAFAAKFVPLPDPIAGRLSQNSEKNAVLTLGKVREVLGMKPGAKPAADVRSQLAEQLNWAELIHTTYFDIPEFVDLAALGLHKAGLANYRADASMAERDEVHQWYKAIEATPV